eukprot:SAG31_NODE_1351_length_8676_cov_3.112044_9_plen_869_part_01
MKRQPWHEAMRQNSENNWHGNVSSPQRSTIAASRGSHEQHDNRRTNRRKFSKSRHARTPESCSSYSKAVTPSECKIWGTAAASQSRRTQRSQCGTVHPGTYNDAITTSTDTDKYRQKMDLHLWRNIHEMQIRIVDSIDSALTPSQCYNGLDALHKLNTLIIRLLQLKNQHLRSQAKRKFSKSTSMNEARCRQRWQHYFDAMECEHRAMTNLSAERDLLWRSCEGAARRLSDIRSRVCSQQQRRKAVESQCEAWRQTMRSARQRLKKARNLQLETQLLREHVVAACSTTQSSADDTTLQHQPAMGRVGRLLEQLGLEQYAGAFYRLGKTDLEHLLEMDSSEYEQLGMQSKDLQRLQKAIESLHLDLGSSHRRFSLGQSNNGRLQLDPCIENTDALVQILQRTRLDQHIGRFYDLGIIDTDKLRNAGQHELSKLNLSPPELKRLLSAISEAIDQHHGGSTSVSSQQKHSNASHAQHWSEILKSVGVGASNVKLQHQQHSEEQSLHIARASLMLCDDFVSDLPDQDHAYRGRGAREFSGRRSAVKCTESQPRMDRRPCEYSKGDLHDASLSELHPKQYSIARAANDSPSSGTRSTFLDASVQQTGRQQHYSDDSAQDVIVSQSLQPREAALKHTSITAEDIANFLDFRHDLQLAQTELECLVTETLQQAQQSFADTITTQARQLMSTMTKECVATCLVSQMPEQELLAVAETVDARAGTVAVAETVEAAVGEASLSETERDPSVAEHQLQRMGTNDRAGTAQLMYERELPLNNAASGERAAEPEEADAPSEAGEHFVMDDDSFDQVGASPNTSDIGSTVGDLDVHAAAHPSDALPPAPVAVAETVEAAVGEASLSETERDPSVAEHQLQRMG